MKKVMNFKIYSTYFGLIKKNGSTEIGSEFKLKIDDRLKLLVYEKCLINDARKKEMILIKFERIYEIIIRYYLNDLKRLDISFLNESLIGTSSTSIIHEDLNTLINISEILVKVLESNNINVKLTMDIKEIFPDIF